MLIDFVCREMSRRLPAGNHEGHAKAARLRRWKRISRRRRPVPDAPHRNPRRGNPVGPPPTGLKKPSRRQGEGWPAYRRCPPRTGRVAGCGPARPPCPANRWLSRRCCSVRASNWRSVKPSEIEHPISAAERKRIKHVAINVSGQNCHHQRASLCLRCGRRPCSESTERRSAAGWSAGPSTDPSPLRLVGLIWRSSWRCWDFGD